MVNEEVVIVGGVCPYERNAREILEEAVRGRVGKREEGYTDNKAIPTTKKIGALEGLATLIGVGARINSLNVDQYGGGFIHQVTYEGHEFIAGSETKIALCINPNQR